MKKSAKLPLVIFKPPGYDITNRNGVLSVWPDRHRLHRSHVGPRANCAPVQSSVRLRPLPTHSACCVASYSAQQFWSCPINSFLIQFGRGKENVPCIRYMARHRVSHNDAGTLYRPVSLREMVHPYTLPNDDDNS